MQLQPQPTQTAVEINLTQILWDYRGNTGFGFVIGLGTLLAVSIAFNMFYSKFIKPLNEGFDALFEKKPETLFTPEILTESIDKIRVEYELREREIIREYDTIIQREKLKTELEEIKSMIAKLSEGKS